MPDLNKEIRALAKNLLAATSWLLLAGIKPMEQLNWLAKANVQARHSVGKAHLTCLHLPVTVHECIAVIVHATMV